VHTVGPRWGEGDEENKLKNSIQNTLGLAVEKGIESIAMPAISAGIFGFPKERCAEIIVEMAADFVKTGSSSLQRIDFYLMDEEIIGFFKNELEKLKAGI
jgi:O-acetyl-ADP-ribose deacetylase